MRNQPYLRSILGGTDFRSLSLIQKCAYINNMLLWLISGSGKWGRKEIWRSISFYRNNNLNSISFLK